MARPAAAKGKAAPVPDPASDRWIWIALALIVLLGAVLRFARLNEAPGGFLVWNEGFYIDSGLANASRGLFSWFVTPTELNKPPLFQGLVSMLLRLDLPQVATARIIPVLAGMATIVLVFLLGRLLFDRSTGLVAAALIAVMPGVVLVDHNIQTDSLMIALTLAGIYFYALSVKTKRTGHAIAGGVCLGLGILTKEPAVLALPALAVWETWGTGGFGWIRKRRVAWFAGIALAVGASWYLLQLATAPAEWMAQMFGEQGLGREGMAGQVDSLFFRFTVNEYQWMLFPLASLLALGGFGFAAWKRRPGDKLLLVLAGTYLAYWLGVHFHSYYLLPLAPVSALAIGRLSTGLIGPKIPWRSVRIALIAALVAVMTLSSVVMLSGQKWGRWSPIGFEQEPMPGYSSVRLYYDPAVEDIFGPSMRHMAPGMEAEPLPLGSAATMPDAEGVESVYLGWRLTYNSGAALPTRAVMMDTWLRPVVFGYAVGQTGFGEGRSSKAQIFTNEPWTAEKVGPFWAFGMHESPVESGLYLYKKDAFLKPAPQ